MKIRELLDENGKKGAVANLVFTLYDDGSGQFFITNHFTKELIAPISELGSFNTIQQLKDVLDYLAEEKETIEEYKEQYEDMKKIADRWINLAKFWEDEYIELVKERNNNDRPHH